MLEQQQSSGSTAWPQPGDNIQKSETPSYFKIVPGYNVIPVGPKMSSYKVANEIGYDLYILAGIDDNELFSKLVTMNLDIPQGIAFDENSVSKISQFFPENIKVIGKKVSFKNDNYHENLSGISGHENIFMKMNTYGEEYLWILSASTDTLNKFKQMVIVFHDINNNPTQQRALNKIKCFKKMTETHDVVHIEPVENNLVVTYFRKNSKSSDLSQTGSVTPLPSYNEEFEDEVLFEISDDEMDEESMPKEISENQIEQLELSRKIKNSTQKVAKKMVKKLFKTMIQEASSELTKEIESILEKFNGSNKQLDVSTVEQEITLAIDEETNAEPKEDIDTTVVEAIETPVESIETKSEKAQNKEPKKRGKKVVDLKADSSSLDEIASADIKEKTEVVEESLPLE